MARLAVIGIDGMDPYVFEKIQSEMPHLSSIMATACYRHYSTVFPPDSIPAWVTIYTGEYPEKHGWLDNIDYEDLRRGLAVNELCNLQGRTFWDIVGQMGKRVCIINPLLAYPVWPVNGIMTNGPVFITGEKQIYPEDLATKYELPELGGMTNFPAEDELEQFLEETLQSTRDLAQFGLNLLQTEPWDLFFISFFTLDRIQHFLWRFWDTSDPLYPGRSTLEDSITKAYKTFDDIVGAFLKKIDDDMGVIVLSDHGHGQRPTMLINLNETLRQEDLLRMPQEISKGAPLKKGLEIAKNTSVRVVVNVMGESWLYRIGRLLPKRMRKALKKSSYLIDKENSIAWASELGGGAAVGGIDINPRLDRDGEEYQNAAAKILESLNKINREAKENVVLWSKVKEEDNFYPDVTFELDPNYSVGRGLFCPILEKNPRHRIISGGHKKEGVFFAYNCGELASNVSSVSDISKGITSYMLSK